MSREVPTGAPPLLPRAPWWSDPRLAGLAAIALALLFASRHHFARLDVESDFMWEYAPHARTMLRGHLPESFPFKGPGYHLLLALCGLVVRDLFWAGKILALASLGLLVGLTGAVARRTYGAAAGPTAALLIVAQPLVLLHGWSVGTDLPFAALSLLVVLLLLPGGDAGAREAGPSTRRLIGVGALAGYVWLMRPNGIFLLPAVMTSLWLTRPQGSRLRSCVCSWLVLGTFFLAPTLVWSIVYHTVHGHWPVIVNVRNLAAASFAERAAMSSDVYRRTLETEVRGLGEVVRSRGLTLLWRTVSNTPVYLGRMAWDIFGPAVAASAVAGLAAVVWRRRSKRLGTAEAATLRVLPVAGVWAFLVLAPLYYEPRFGLFLAAPVAILGTAFFFPPRASPGLEGSVVPMRGAVRRLLPIAGIMLIGGIGLWQGVRLGHAQLKSERVVEPMYLAAKVIRERTNEPGGVCARKPHIAFLADRPLVPFPDAPLESLADSLRARGVAFLYYGVVEAELLPGYAGLLSAETIPPGLRLVCIWTGNSLGLLFRVEPKNERFPVPPQARAGLDQIRASLERAGLWRRIQTRLGVDAYQEGVFLVSRGRYAEAIPLLQTAATQDSSLGATRYYLGVAFLETGRAAAGLASIEAALRLGFETAEVRMVQGRALQTLGQLPEARLALARALELQPELGPARFFLAQVEARAGHFDQAESLLSQSLGQGVPEDSAFVAFRAYVLVMAGRLDRADSLLDVAVTRYPRSAELLFLGGYMALRTGQPEQARQRLEEAKRVNPSDSRIDSLLKSLPK